MSAHRRTTALPLLLEGLGALALFGSGAIHLYLWDHGYRQIPTIGRLFLLQGAVAVLLGLVVLVWRSPVSALAGAGFLVSTVGGLLLSCWVGLFGFRDSLAAPYAGWSLVIEAVGAAALGAAVGLLYRPGHRLIPSGRAGSRPAQAR